MKQTGKLLAMFLLLVTSFTGAHAQAVGTFFELSESGPYKVVYRIINNDLTPGHVDNKVEVYNITGSGSVIVPSTVQHPASKETYKVTQVAAWTSCSDEITSLTFSENLETIGNGCYRGLKKLEKVTFPKSLKLIGHNCFNGCDVLKSFYVMPGNPNYSSTAHGTSNWLFSRDGKTLVKFPTGISGDVQIPQGITTLAPTAFFSAREVNKISLPASLKIIDKSENASFAGVATEFAVDASNQSYTAVNGVLCSKNKDTLVCFPSKYPNEKLEGGNKYTVPAEVKVIGGTAFYQPTTSMTTLDLNNTKKISAEAISQARGLESITIGKSVEEIEGGAVTNCPNLTKYIVDAQNKKYKGADDMVYTHDMKGFVLCPSGKTGNYTIKEGTEYVDTKAFINSSLSVLKFPSSLKEIRREAVRNTKISKIDFGSNSQLTTIGQTAFADNSNLAGSITIPANVMTVGASCFTNTKVTAVALAEGSKMEVLSNGFADMSELTTFTFPQSNSLKTINSNAFANNTKLTSIEIPENVTVIDKGAFVNTENLRTITFRKPASIQTIGDGSFGNSAIDAIELPEGLRTIDKQAFDNCKNLTTITIPKTVDKIEIGAFNFTENMQKFAVSDDNQHFSTVDGILTSKDKTTLQVFPSGKANNKYTSLPYFKKIAAYSFYNSKKISNVTIPRTVTTIEDRAFALCTELSSISFMGTDQVPELKETILFSSKNPKEVMIYVRKAWYENNANAATVSQYRARFKQVHPSFIVNEGYDRGVEFFPTAINAAGVISFYNPRTSVIIGKSVKEAAYTDKYNVHWNETTYDVSAILDYAFEATTANKVEMVTVLADINEIGLDAFKATTLKELYFVRDTPPALASTKYNVPDKYPFNSNADLKIYVKKSKLESYKTQWNVGHTLHLDWQIPAKTLGKRATACYPFDVVYDQSKDVKPYVTLRLDESSFKPSELAKGQAYVWSRSIDDFTVPAYQPVLLVSKNTDAVTSYCEIKDLQNAPAINTSGFTDYMAGTVEDTKLMNAASDTYSYYGLSKDGIFKKVKAAPTGNNLRWFKSYLKIKKSDIPAGAKSIVFLFDGEFNPQVPTDINGINVESGNDNGVYYNLNGIQTEKPQRGMYIHKGKKVIIK